MMAKIIGMTVCACALVFNVSLFCSQITSSGENERQEKIAQMQSIRKQRQIEAGRFIQPIYEQPAPGVSKPSPLPIEKKYRDQLLRKAYEAEYVEQIKAYMDRAVDGLRDSQEEVVNLDQDIKNLRTKYGSSPYDELRELYEIAHRKQVEYKKALNQLIDLQKQLVMHVRRYHALLVKDPQSEMPDFLEKIQEEANAWIDVVIQKAKKVATSVEILEGVTADLLETPEQESV